MTLRVLLLKSPTSLLFNKVHAQLPNIIYFLVSEHEAVGKFFSLVHGISQAETARERRFREDLGKVGCIAEGLSNGSSQYLEG